MEQLLNLSYQKVLYIMVQIEDYFGIQKMMERNGTKVQKIYQMVTLETFIPPILWNLGSICQ